MRCTGPISWSTEADVHAYGERLAAERRARGLPDLKLPKS